MYYSDLLDRMKRNDSEAFLEMTERYGWALYSAVREKYTDHKVADKVYNEAMNAFYHSLSDSDAEDPLEALLLGFADRISPDNFIFDQAATGEVKGVPEFPLCQHSLSSKDSVNFKRKRMGICNCLGLLILLVFIACCLWIIAGFLMKMNYIPFIDLGYSWLDTKVMQFLNL